MTVFAYKGLDIKGQAVNGSVDGPDEAQAVSRLAAEGHYVTEIAEGRQVAGSAKGRIKRSDVTRFTRQLATLLAAGLPLARSFETIASEEPNLAFKAVLRGIQEAIHGGKSLSEAMQAYPAIFARLYVSLVRVGEAGGVLDRMCVELADFLEREGEVRNNVITALIYPSVVAGMGVFIVFFFMTFIFPRLLAPMVQMKMELPLATRILQVISQAFAHWWWLGAALLGFGWFSWRNYLRTAKGRENFDRAKLRLPLIGDFLRRLSIMRFAMTLSTLLKCGVPIVEALEIVRNVLGNEHLALRLDSALSEIRHGGAIGDTLLAEGFLPAMAAQMVTVGEESGRLDEVLGHMAASYDGEVRRAVQRMEAVLAPAIIVVIAVFVAFIIISVMIPILDISSSMKM